MFQHAPARERFQFYWLGCLLPIWQSDFYRRHWNGVSLKGRYVNCLLGFVLMAEVLIAMVWCIVLQDSSAFIVAQWATNKVRLGISKSVFHLSQSRYLASSWLSGRRWQIVISTLAVLCSYPLIPWYDRIRNNGRWEKTNIYFLPCCEHCS